MEPVLSCAGISLRVKSGGGETFKLNVKTPAQVRARAFDSAS